MFYFYAFVSLDYEISSCTAFNAGPDVHFHNLLNENGQEIIATTLTVYLCKISTNCFFRCPLDESILTPFRSGPQKQVLQAELTMFRFNGSHEFNIQCSIVKCPDECTDRNCRKPSNAIDNLYDSNGQQQQIFINGASSIVGARLTVRDHNTTNGKC